MMMKPVGKVKPFPPKGKCGKNGGYLLVVKAKQGCKCGCHKLMWWDKADLFQENLWIFWPNWLHLLHVNCINGQQACPYGYNQKKAHKDARCFCY